MVEGATPLTPLHQDACAPRLAHRRRRNRAQDRQDLRRTRDGGTIDARRREAALSRERTRTLHPQRSGPARKRKARHPHDERSGTALRAL